MASTMFSRLSFSRCSRYSPGYDKETHRFCDNFLLIVGYNFRLAVLILLISGSSKVLTLLLLLHMNQSRPPTPATQSAMIPNNTTNHHSKANNNINSSSNSVVRSELYQIYVKTYFHG